MSQEQKLWSGTPSQVVNFSSYIFLGLFCWLVVPLFIILWKWLVLKNTKYELTSQRLRTHRGVLSKRTDEIELYRIKDYQVEQPFFLRLFSLGNVVLISSDKSIPAIRILAVEKPQELREQLRTHVEICRDTKRVREFD